MIFLEIDEIYMTFMEICGKPTGKIMKLMETPWNLYEIYGQLLETHGKLMVESQQLEPFPLSFTDFWMIYEYEAFL